MSWDWEVGAPVYRRQVAWPSLSPASFRRWSSRGASGWKGGQCKYPAHQGQEAEWKCLGCNEGNWLSRTHCRGCKAAKSTGVSRSREENLSMLEALQSVIDVLGDNPLLDEIKQKIGADVKKLEKKTTDNRSLAKQLVTSEEWIKREEKRITTAEEQLEADKTALEERRGNFQITLAKLVSLREAIVKEAEFKDPVPGEPTHMEANVDETALQTKELDISRKVAGKKDDKGAPIGARRLKEMEKEADGIRDKIESATRIKIQVGSPRTPEGAGAAHKAAGSGA